MPWHAIDKTLSIKGSAGDRRVNRAGAHLQIVVSKLSKERTIFFSAI